MASRPLLDRHEIKYAIPERLVPDIRAFIRPYVRQDAFSPAPGASYAVSSLYLDTEDLRLARETLGGVRQRFKTRIRAYGDGAHELVFCEVKRRDGDVIHKRRAALRRERVARLLDGGAPAPGGEANGDRAALAEFQGLLRGLGLRPVLVVRYDREAYESAFGAPIRVTLDRGLSCVHADGFSIPVHAGGFVPVKWHQDPTALFLEVKFTGAFPRWVQDMVRRLEIRQRGAGKYVLAARDMFRINAGARIRGSLTR